jgi:hypothetical protein
MKSTPWGSFSKASAERFRQEREERNREFIKQRIPLPTGATFTVCRPGAAAAQDAQDQD